jgi:hypothetical protein
MKANKPKFYNQTKFYNQINFYNQVEWNPRKPYREDRHGDSLKEFRRHAHLLDSTRSPEGKVSKLAKRKITKAIDYLLLFASDKTVTSIKTGRKFSFKKSCRIFS